MHINASNRRDFYLQALLNFAFFAFKLSSLSNKGISVVIPNYNGIQLLPKILPPLLKALAFTALPYEVIISDDCSKDDSIAFLQKEFPGVKIIANKENKGFSPTMNKGILAARYDYVLLLNSDVMLEENYFIPLLRYFDKEDTFGVMGRIIGWEDDIIQDAAKYPSFHGAKIKTTGNYLPKEPKKNDWLYSMYLSGANALVNRKKLIVLRGFDEIFAPFYVEDYELSIRAWRLGWKCYYEHFAVCRHKSSVSIKSNSSKNYVNTIYYRNKMYLHAMHLSKGQSVAWYAQLFPETIFSVLTGKFYFLRSLKLFFQNSKKIQRSKKNFLTLAQSLGKTLLSVKAIADTITQSVSGRDIERF